MLVSVRCVVHVGCVAPRGKLPYTSSTYSTLYVQYPTPVRTVPYSMQEASTRGPYGHLLRGDMGEWPAGTVRTYSAEAQAGAPGRMCRHGVAKGESTLNPNPNPKP